MASIHGNHDGSFLFYPWITSKKNNVLPKKHPSSCTTFSLYVRLSMNSFYCYTPNPHKPKRPCFPKASAKVQPFTINTKYYGHFFQAETPANLEKLPQTNKEYAVKHIFNTRNHARFKRELFYRWKKKETKEKEKRVEKPLNFAPFGHPELSPLATIWLPLLVKIVLPTCFTYYYRFFV